ncbi:MAG TPA: AraC family transcriptional regulator [Nevskia sp.]|nr:AraC family transcriptional regulator [Nevskia sp.]
MLDQAAEKVFASILGTHQIAARITDNVVYCGEWIDREPQVDRGIFHLVSAGSCRVEARYLPEPVVLHSGDLIVFPRGAAHTLCQVMRSGPELPPDTGMLCGEFTSSGGRRNPLLEALPDWFVVRDDGGSLRSLGRLLAEESHNAVFGNQVMLNKLSDSLLTLAIRSHVLREPARQGLLAALNDPRLTRALLAMHEDPGRDWSLAELAGVAHLSRTAFCEHFAEVLGMAPMQYLTEWRMAEALRLLRDPAQSVARIAERLGYQTEAAFRRAFKRVQGFAPGKVRQEA